VKRKYCNTQRGLDVKAMRSQPRAKYRGDRERASRSQPPEPGRSHHRRQCALLRPAISRPATRQGKGRRTARAEMSFFFRMASRLRPSTPEEVVRSIKDSFLALHTRTHAKVISESLRLLPPFSRASSPVSSSSRAFFFFLGDLEASRSMRTRSLIASGDGIGCAGFISVRSSSLGSPPRAC
jgi:hypothetical protein